MNQSFIFSKDSKNHLLYYLAFLPIIIYGLYKNVYLLFSNNYININKAVQISLYPVGCILLGFLVSFLLKKRKREVITFAFLMGVAVPYSINVYLYFLMVTATMIVVALVPNKYKINEAAFLITLFTFINYFTNNISFLNPMEINSSFKYSTLDLFFGRGASYLYTSSIFYLLISYLILTFVKTYKKRIFILSISTFTLLSLIYMIATKDYVNSIQSYLNGTTFFSFIFLAPINESSPSTNNMKVIYSVLLGILSFLFVYIFGISTGSVIATFIVSVLNRLYDLARQNMFLKKV